MVWHGDVGGLVQYLDSGATKHITYGQPEVVIGFTLLMVILCGSRNLVSQTLWPMIDCSLSMTLSISSFSKHLLSIKQFCFDNNASLEFSSQRAEVLRQMHKGNAN